MTRAQQQPPADVRLADQAHRCLQRLAAPRCRQPSDREQHWQQRATQALMDYRAAELGLAQTLQVGDARAVMAALQRIFVALGELRVACDRFPDATLPWVSGLLDLMTRLVDRQRLLASHLTEGDTRWHLGPHLQDVVSPLRRAQVAAARWRPPPALAEVLRRAEGWSALDKHLGAGQTCLRSWCGRDGGRVVWWLRSWALQRASEQLRDARRLLAHDGRPDAHRPVYLWRRRLGLLAEPLAQSVELELVVIAAHHHRLQLQMAKAKSTPPKA